MTCVSIGSGNGLSPVRRQAITWTNADLSSIRPLGRTFSENSNKNSDNFVKENAFYDVVCEMAAILSRRRWVDIHRLEHNDPKTGHLPCTICSSDSSPIVVIFLAERVRQLRVRTRLNPTINFYTRCWFQHSWLAEEMHNRWLLCVGSYTTTGFPNWTERVCWKVKLKRSYV